MDMVKLTEEDLRRMMADPRYRNSAHPEYESFTRRVAEGFRQLYGDQPARKDATGRIVGPDPIKGEPSDPDSRAPDWPPTPPLLPEGWSRVPGSPNMAVDQYGRAQQWMRDPLNPFRDGYWTPAVGNSHTIRG